MQMYNKLYDEEELVIQYTRSGDIQVSAVHH